MKGEQALGLVTHALMRKQYPYRPGHPGAHHCPAKSMVETPTMAAPCELMDYLNFRQAHGQAYFRQAAN